MNKKTIEKLIEIKLSIIENASDTLWMRNSNSTICEELDSILEPMGVAADTLEKHYNIPVDRSGSPDRVNIELLDIAKLTLMEWEAPTDGIERGELIARLSQYSDLARKAIKNYEGE